MTDRGYLICPFCDAPLGAYYVEIRGLVYARIGGVILDTCTCAKCGKRLFFKPSSESLESLIARWRTRRAQLDALTAAAIEDIHSQKGE